MDSISERSAMRCSAVPVDDARAIEIVGGELAAHAIAGEDADPEAPHLAGDVPEHHVVVVQLHTKHRVRQGLDHLALEFNLVLLGHAASHLVAPASLTGDRSFVFRDSNYQREGRDGGSGVRAANAQPGEAPPVFLIPGSLAAGGVTGSPGGFAGPLGAGVGASLSAPPPVSLPWPPGCEPPVEGAPGLCGFLFLCASASASLLACARPVAANLP